MKYRGGVPIYECPKKQCGKVRKKENRFCSLHMEIAENIKQFNEVFQGV